MPAPSQTTGELQPVFYFAFSLAILALHFSPVCVSLAIRIPEFFNRTTRNTSSTDNDGDTPLYGDSGTDYSQVCPSWIVTNPMLYVISLVLATVLVVLSGLLLHPLIQKCSPLRALGRRCQHNVTYGVLPPAATAVEARQTNSCLRLKTRDLGFPSGPLPWRLSRVILSIE